MPQFDNPNPFSQAEGMTPPAERRTSGLAVTSFIMSIIFCCPLTTIPAFFMGLIAVTKTGPHTAFKGRGLAIAAILISVIGTGAQIYYGSLGYGLIKKFMTTMQEKPQEVMDAGFQGDWSAFREGIHLKQGASFTDEEAAQFIETLRERYGAIISITPDEQGMSNMTPNYGQPETTFPYQVEFENNASVRARVTIIWADPQQSDDFILKIGSITILDPDLGDVTFPAAITEGAGDAALSPDVSPDGS